LVWNPVKFDYTGWENRVSTERTSIAIRINGENRAVSDGQTISGLLASLDLDPQRVAIELDGRIVRRPLWDTTEIRAGAELEIVQFVGGG
jgi:thiamine biosynthesis protein ThiS